MSDYDIDVLRWSERQSALLRRVAAGERVADNDMDWPNVIEGIESVGRSQVEAVEFLLTQAFVHELKAQGWPLARDVLHWQAEARLFRRQAKRRFTPSMRQKLDVPGLYADALAGLSDSIDDQPPMPVPTECPVTLDDLVGG